MKQILLFTIVLLMLSAFFLTGCNKNLAIKGNTPLNDSTKSVALIHSAIFSTVVSDYFSYTTVDKAGNIYALKYPATNTVFKISASGQETSFYISEKIAPDTSSNSFSCLTTDSLGNVYTISRNSFTHIQSILKITPTGSVSTFLSNLTQYLNPLDVFIYKMAIDENGNIYIDDIDGIEKLTPGGTLTSILKSSVENHFTVDKNGNVIYIASNTDIIKVSPQGTQTTISTSGKLNFNNIGDITVDKLGDIFIGELDYNGNNNIYVINADSKLFTLISSTNGHVDGPVATAKIYEPIYMSTDDAGELYFFEVSNNGAGNDIRKVTF